MARMREEARIRDPLFIRGMVKLYDGQSNPQVLTKNAHLKCNILLNVYFKDRNTLNIILILYYSCISSLLQKYLQCQILHV